MARLLVLGAYGVVGSFIARDLERAGHEVIGLGRDREAARRTLPGRAWVFRDIKTLTRRDDWLGLLRDVDFVVNCIGALQSNPKDRLEIIHLGAIGALVLACEKADVGLIQFSAVGADPAARLEYHRTKAEGDALIRESHVKWWIFRPGFVLSPQSFGNTTLIRTFASVPLILPLVHPKALVQTISVRDVARAVRRAVAGLVPPGTEADLVEPVAHRMEDVLLTTRAWLGFATPARVVALPGWLMRVTSRGADVLALFGWRSPMRSGPMRIIEGGVSGDARQTRQVLGRDAMDLSATMAAHPAQVEDRLYVRMQILAPILIFVLALTWIAEGLVALASLRTGADLAHGAGHERVISSILAVVTLALGLSLFVRRWAMRALWLMILVSIYYLVAATLVVPELWANPAGPLIAVFSQILLIMVTRLLLETR